MIDVRCSLTFVPHPPSVCGGEGLASATELLVSSAGSDPLLGVSHLARGARFGFGTPLVVGGSIALAERRAAVPVGVTVDVALQPIDIELAFRSAVDAPFAILLAHRDERDARVAFVLRGTAPGADGELRELIELAIAPTVDGEPLWVALPSPFAADTTILAELSLRTPTPDDATHRAALARCLADLKSQGDAARLEIAALDDAQMLASALNEGLATLAKPFDLRRAVVFLAERTRAEVCVDLALACDDDTLKDLADRMRSLAGETGVLSADDAPGMRWALDRLAWTLLAERLDAGRIDTAQRGFLLRRAGEAGRFPGTIAAILARVDSPEAVTDALAQENYAFLSTSDPASRVRAFDWLVRTGRAPADYDPFADREARRAALRRHDAARVEAGATDR